MRSLVGGVAEAVLPDHRAGVQRNAMAKHAMVIDGDVGEYDAVVAQCGVRADVRAGIDDAVAANDSADFHDCVRVYARALANACFGMHRGKRTDDRAGVCSIIANRAQRLRMNTMAVQRDHRVAEGEIWIAGSQHCNIGRAFSGLAHEHGGCACAAQMFGVFDVGQKGDFARPGLIEWRTSMHHGIGITLKRGPYSYSKLAQRHVHRRMRQTSPPVRKRQRHRLNL